MSDKFEKVLNKAVFRTISELTVKNNVQAYLVGGYVRDLILDRPSVDIDVVVSGDGIAFATQLAEALKGEVNFSVFKNFGTASVKTSEFEIEFVGARKESYRRDSRKPIVETGSIEDDLTRRDFTINTLAISLNANDFGKLYDRFDGLKDLDNRLIKTPQDPQLTFSDDPLRMLRAVRFACQLDFKLDDRVYKAIQSNVNRIEIVSQERITDELNKIILSSRPAIGFKLLFESGLLEIIFPELYELHGVESINDKSHKDNFYHTIQVLENLSEHTDNLWLLWAAILHDIGKPATKRFDKKHGWTFHGHEVVGARMVPKIFRRLKLPLNEKMKYVRKLVALHLRPIALTNESVTDSAMRRLLMQAGEDLDDLMALCRADITSKNENKVKTYLRRFDKVCEKLEEVEESDKLRNWQPPVTGETIMKAFDIPPSKVIGEIKEAIKEAILNGDIPNEKEAAYEFMIECGKKSGLQPKKKQIKK